MKNGVGAKHTMHPGRGLRGGHFGPAVAENLRNRTPHEANLRKDDLIATSQEKEGRKMPVCPRIDWTSAPPDQIRAAKKRADVYNGDGGNAHKRLLCSVAGNKIQRKRV